MSWGTYIPIEIPAQENMTEEEFFRFCAANKHIKIEREPEFMRLAGLSGTSHNRVYICNRFIQTP